MEFTRIANKSLISFNEKPSAFACRMKLSRLRASSEKIRYPEIVRDARGSSRRLS
jgi:hypothetical protein